MFGVVRSGNKCLKDVFCSSPHSHVSLSAMFGENFTQLVHYPHEPQNSVTLVGGDI